MLGVPLPHGRGQPAPSCIEIVCAEHISRVKQCRRARLPAEVPCACASPTGRPPPRHNHLGSTQPAAITISNYQQQSPSDETVPSTSPRYRSASSAKESVVGRRACTFTCGGHIAPIRVWALAGTLRDVAGLEGSAYCTLLSVDWSSVAPWEGGCRPGDPTHWTRRSPSWPSATASTRRAASRGRVFCPEASCAAPQALTALPARADRRH